LILLITFIKLILIISRGGDMKYPAWISRHVVRVVAAQVVVLSALAVLTGFEPIVWLLTVDFAIRAFLGPKFSPLATIGRQIVPKRLQGEVVSSTPKRFAARLGFMMFATASIFWTGFGMQLVGQILVATVMVLATLEAVAGFCLGCVMYAQLVKAGLLNGNDCPTCVKSS
jgi:hypothetical protein